MNLPEMRSTLSLLVSELAGHVRTAAHLASSPRIYPFTLMRDERAGAAVGEERVAFVDWPIKLRAALVLSREADDLDKQEFTAEFLGCGLALLNPGEAAFSASLRESPEKCSFRDDGWFEALDTTGSVRFRVTELEFEPLKVEHVPVGLDVTIPVALPAWHVTLRAVLRELRPEIAPPVSEIIARAEAFDVRDKQSAVVVTRARAICVAARQLQRLEELEKNGPNRDSEREVRALRAELARLPRFQGGGNQTLWFLGADAAELRPHIEAIRGEDSLRHRVAALQEQLKSLEKGAPADELNEQIASIQKQIDQIVQEENDLIRQAHE